MAPPPESSRAVQSASPSSRSPAEARKASYAGRRDSGSAVTMRRSFILVDLTDHIDDGVVTVHDHAHDTVLIADGVGHTHDFFGPLLELLDTPGILWPRFDDPEVGKRLAFTGAIKDDVVDMEELACYLMDYLSRRYAPVLAERYKIEVEPEDSGYDLLEKAGRKRGFLMRGAQVDTQRMARVLLDEFRGGKLGRFTLETVEDAQ